MSMKAKFLIQTRFPAERRWRTYQGWFSITDALTEAGELATARRQDTSRWFFPNVRIVYRGFTLHRWQNGYVR